MRGSGRLLFAVLVSLINPPTHVRPSFRSVLEGAEERKKIYCESMYCFGECVGQSCGFGTFWIWKNTKMHVFAPFAQKGARPRAPGPYAVPHRAERVENAKKSHDPKKNRVEKLWELGLGCLGSSGFEWVWTF